MLVTYSIGLALSAPKPREISISSVCVPLLVTATLVALNTARSTLLQPPKLWLAIAVPSNTSENVPQSRLPPLGVPSTATSAEKS